MTQAITTKYFPPTNHKPSRIKASCAAKSIYTTFDSELTIHENHRRACLALLKLLQWKGTFYSGGDPKSDGYFWVETGKDRPADISAQ